MVGSLQMSFKNIWLTPKVYRLTISLNQLTNQNGVGLRLPEIADFGTLY